MTFSVIFVERITMVVRQTVSREVFASIVSREAWVAEKYLCDVRLITPITGLSRTQINISFTDLIMSICNHY